MSEVKLDEKFFNQYFAKIDLGVRPPDNAEDEESLAGAIGKLWSLQLETEFAADLWMSALIGTKPRSGIIEKTELTRKHSGDTLHISKAAALSNDGSLGTTHTLVGNEENLDLSQVSFAPARVGNAVKWRSKAEHSVSFDIRVEVKNLLASWAAEAVERRLLAACDLCSAANTLYGGTAVSVGSVTPTDVIQAQDLLRLYACLLDSGAKGIQELGGYYALIMHPRQWLRKIASSMSNHSRYRVNSGKPKSLRYGNPEPSLPLRKGRKVQRLELRRFKAPGSWLTQDEDIVQVR